MNLLSCESLENIFLIETLFLTDSYEFLSSANDQCDILNGMTTKTSQLYEEVADYFSFNLNKYSMDEFFADIKTFIDGFNVSRINKFYFYFPEDAYQNNVKTFFISFSKKYLKLNLKTLFFQTDISQCKLMRTSQMYMQCPVPENLQ